MKHPRFKGTKVLDLEVEKCEHNLSQKEIEFHWALKQLKNADPDKDDIHKLRKVFRSKEKQVIKARRQLKSKQSQKTNKLNERNGIKNGGIAKKRERLALNKALTQEMREQEGILSQLKNTKIEFSSEAATEKIGTDLFISHASEDKDDFVRDLADELISQGVSVWYDEYTLKIGDRLRRSIDKGLSESKYGLIVISKSFIKKDWPQYELDGLIMKEMEGNKVILPIWHNITKDEIMKFSPTLLDKVALNTAVHSVKEIAKQVADAIKSA